MHLTAPSPHRQALAPPLVAADWLTMMQAEPRLRTLAVATAAAGRLSSHRVAAWHSIRQELTTLVGWFCGNPAMDSCHHWNTARGRLRHLFVTGGRR